MLKRAARAIVRRFGYELVHQTAPELAKEDMDPEFWPIYESCRDFTMTSLQRMYALYEAVRYAVQARVPGAFVECGVWKGGSAMLAAYTLKELGVTDRDLFLYDTFAGMTAPGEIDVDPWQRPARITWESLQRSGRNEWCYAPLDEVRRNLLATGYPAERLMLVKGRIEQTIPATLPGEIAILRLDTDWYESTQHELKHLFPLVSARGVLIIDDYGYWKGARQAVDEYFRRDAPRLLLQRIDSTGRMAVKTS